MTVTDTKTIVTDAKTIASDTKTMVADMHRNMLTEREGASGKNHSVSIIRLSNHQQQNAYHLLESSQVSDTECYGVRGLTFSKRTSR
jgi:hypothetical protein